MSKSSVALYELAYDKILEMIMTKQLLPGDRIPENNLAEQYGISRTPVRDALKLLSNDGLIDIYPNRFAMVREYSFEEIRKVGVLRLSLDTMAIKLSQLYGSQADFLELKKIAEDCIEAQKKNVMEERIQLDSHFHVKLAVISRNDLLMKFQREISLRVRFIILCHPNSVENETKHLNQHLQIADALLERDEKTAMQIIVDHLTSFYNLRESYPNHFFDFLKNS